MKRFFSYDPNGDGFTTHDTAEEAEKAAKEGLDAEREEAREDGWSDEASRICWGELRQFAKKTLVPPSPTSFEAYEEYTLTDTTPQA